MTQKLFKTHNSTQYSKHLHSSSFTHIKLALKVLGNFCPLTSCITTVLSEIESRELESKLRELEDPISYMHEDIPALCEIIFNYLKQIGEVFFELDSVEYNKYIRAITLLSNQGLIHQPLGYGYPRTHHISLEYDFIFYLLVRFQSEKAEQILKHITELKVRETMYVADLESKLCVEPVFIVTIFKIFESADLGNCGGGLNVKSYRAKA